MSHEIVCDNKPCRKIVDTSKEYYASAMIANGTVTPKDFCSKECLKEFHDDVDTEPKVVVRGLFDKKESEHHGESQESQ